MKNELFITEINTALTVLGDKDHNASFDKASTRIFLCDPLNCEDFIGISDLTVTKGQQHLSFITE